jgi:lipopolysaccharide biosynthesis regulator YciM
MPDAASLTLLLLPVAAASGWYLARRAGRMSHQKDVAVNADYLQGLGYLVNEDADKAIQVFTRLLEVDHDTVEIHLALGNLFRRQGEVDRALRIHQNLVARPNLSDPHRNQARFELARDYLRAGMLDRAEDLFSEITRQGPFREQALTGLVGIYEQERDWPRALEVTRELEAVRGHSLRPVIAQYLCELADEARRTGDQRGAAQHLQEAYAEYHECVRASLMQGEIEEAQGNFENAARAYRRVIEQDIEFAGEVIEPLARCYERLSRPEALREFLEQITARYDGPAPRIAMAHQLMRQGHTSQAVEYLARALQAQPSWVGLEALLLLAPVADDPLRSSLDSLRAALKRVTEASPRYQCSHCGFHARTLYWQCPGCRQWNSVTPLKDVVPKIV